MKHLPLLSLLGLASVFSAPLQSQDTAVARELSLAALHARDVDTLTAATRFAFSARQDLTFASIPGAWFTEARGVLALDEEANTEGVSGQVGAEFSRHYGTTTLTVQPPPLSPYLTPPSASPSVPKVRSDASGFRIGAGVAAGFETDQTWRNNQFTVGPRLNLTNAENSGFWPLLPSLTAAYQRVYVVKGASLLEHAINDRASWRLDLTASWKWRPFGAPDVSPAPALARFNLSADMRYSRAYQMSARARALDLDDAFYTAGTISYDLGRLTSHYVQAVYITVAQGRIAPTPHHDTTVFLGFTVLR